MSDAPNQLVLHRADRPPFRAVWNRITAPGVIVRFDDALGETVIDAPRPHPRLIAPMFRDRRVEIEAIVDDTSSGAWEMFHTGADYAANVLIAGEPIHFPLVRIRQFIWPHRSRPIHVTFAAWTKP